LGPLFQAFRHALFKFIVGQIKVLRYGVRLTVIPIVRAVTPFLEFCIESLINTGLEAYRYWKLHGAEIMMRIRTLSKTSIAVVFQYGTFWFRLSYRYLKIVYSDYWIPMSEKTKQVMLHLYPKIKKFVLAIFSVCEYLDDQLRPIFMPAIAFILFQVKFMLAFYWKSLGVIYDSLCLFASIPIRISKVYIGVIVDIAQSSFRRVQTILGVLFHVLKPHVLLLWNHFAILFVALIGQVRLLVEQLEWNRKLHDLKQFIHYSIQQFLVYVDWTANQLSIVLSKMAFQMKLLFHAFTQRFAS
jgi:hypothetical protein